VVYDASDQQLFLATLPPTRRQIRLAYSVIAALLVLACAAVPYAHLPLQPVTALVPVYATTILVCNLITATLLFGQFWVLRWKCLLVLASGFLFTAVLIVPFALTFPGVFGPFAPAAQSTRLLGWGLGLGSHRAKQGFWQPVSPTASI
jgi:hypothetical protein